MTLPQATGANKFNDITHLGELTLQLAVSYKAIQVLSPHTRS